MAQRIRNRRLDILTAATEEFDNHGFAGARVQRIAERAGVNKQLLFYYFGSKSRLYSAVLAQSTQQLGDRPTANSEGSCRATLRREVVATYDALAARPHLTKLLTLDRGVAEHATELATATIEPLLRRFTDVVSDGQRLGYFRDNTDPDTAAHHALGLILGHLALEQVRGGGPPGSERADLCEGIVQVLLRSLEW